MGRHANPDIRRAFAEFQDQETPSKCNKVRCRHCGYVRAKNTTRQIEHLQECQAYLASSDAQTHLLAQRQQQDGTPAEPNMAAGSSQIFSGQQPNPNLQVQRRGPNTSKRARDTQPIIAPKTVPVPTVMPSLTAHLLNVCAGPLRQATQRPFLSHAGCGSLTAEPLSWWLVQDGHYARGFIRFAGQLLAKIRLPQTPNSQFHPMYRTMDLLISALNNMRREIQFSEITATKYGLSLGTDLPTPVTRGLLDLLVSASSSSASLLEGMVVLWGTEHAYRAAWQYAATFSSSLPTSISDSHIAALHQVLIPNWTSPPAYKFLDATRALVDELANITTTRDGKEEMVRCEELFRQICWLAERYWPAIDENGGWIDPPMGYTIPGTRPVTMNRNVVHPNMTAPSMHAPGMNMHGNPVNGNMAGPAPTPNMHGHVNTNMSNNANPNPNINTSTSMNTNANNSNNNRNNPAPIAPINAGVRKESTSVNDNRSQQSMDRGNSMDSDSGESSA
ncbi:hypothetical protein COCCADRAFT_25701 [Bipolaris zeicola 26-R-13]|uniref:Thiaminase-2/PQQC domain-containing protein n=1 Tax=Cochliobolus carbonum (strain 26-R-13) TaxID=930089 RepID=W6Y841_COCC2|nr:uncharacterized protein COCCADRAFT_25701 [Bipolaris zeicola 26-R-13]EUC34118.1 hypothetical protein COCCADRAFT_25701 [Bipolaris zeicola 26-R-13]